MYVALAGEPKGRSDANESFQIHKHILMKSEWFRKTLSGEFREKDEQAVDLPEEDPAVFHFIVAYLYEERYTPIRPIATVLGKSRPAGVRL